MTSNPNHHLTGFRSAVRHWKKLNKLDKEQMNKLRHKATSRVEDRVSAVTTCLDDSIESLKVLRNSTVEWATAKLEARKEPWKTLTQIFRRQHKEERTNVKQSNDLHPSEHDERDSEQNPPVCSQNEVDEATKAVKTLLIIEIVSCLLALKRSVLYECRYLTACIKEIISGQNKWLVTGVSTATATLIYITEDLIYFFYFDLGIIALKSGDLLSASAMGRFILHFIIALAAYLGLLVIMKCLATVLAITKLTSRTLRVRRKWYAMTRTIDRRIAKSKGKLSNYVTRGVGFLNPPVKSVTKLTKRWKSIKKDFHNECADICDSFYQYRESLLERRRKTMLFSYVLIPIMLILLSLGMEKSYDAYRTLAGDYQIVIVPNNPDMPTLVNVSKVGTSDSYVFVTTAFDKGDYSQRDLSRPLFPVVDRVQFLQKHLLTQILSGENGTRPVSAITRDSILCMESARESASICTDLKPVPEPPDVRSIPSILYLAIPASPDLSIIEDGIMDIQLSLENVDQAVLDAGSTLVEILKHLKSVPEVATDEELTRNQLSEIVRNDCDGHVEVLEPILFERDKDVIVGGNDALSSIVSQLNRSAPDRLYVIGFASPDGNQGHNLSLALDRREFVISFLRNRGNIDDTSIYRLDELDHLSRQGETPKLGGENHRMQGIANSRSVWVIRCN